MLWFHSSLSLELNFFRLFRLVCCEMFRRLLSDTACRFVRVYPVIRKSAPSPRYVFGIQVARFHRSLTNEAARYFGHPRNSGERYPAEYHHEYHHLLQQFPYAKDTLLYLATLLQEDLGHNALRLRIDSRRHESRNVSYWESIVTVKWPHDLQFYGKAATKGESARIAYAYTCAKLKSLGILDKSNKPVLYSKERLSDIRAKRYAPTKLELNSDVVEAIESWNQKFFDARAAFSGVDGAQNPSDIWQEPEIQEALKTEQLDYVDMVHGRNAVTHPTRLELEDISDNLYANHVRLMNSQDTRVRAILDQRAELPVFAKREEILDTIREHPVTIISGDTGSGKSTQIPQFIFENLVEKNRGSEAQIIVTQPRRISAISIAERVAKERNEDLGKTVGYQVRLEATFPERNTGCIFFCTTGVLLRRLQDNPTLKGVSHIIVDEVHERDVLIDVLLTLLKNAMTKNPDLRVVLMSASLNTGLLKSYFDNCPIVEVEGYLHPVKEYYLPEISSMLSTSPATPDDEPRTDLNYLFQLIKHLDRTRPEGGILVFLPGWQEIKTLRNRLLQDLYRPDRHFILALHSMIPLREQHLVFEKCAPFQRKIVLSTNIAETAVTINDICYVIDSGTQRGQNFDHERGISTLDTQWISRANAIQRRGRAGRVRAGECYRLYPKEHFLKMDPFPKPEILRTSLEKVILDAKVLCPTSANAAEFFEQLPEPPESDGIKKAVEELKSLRILNADESLTVLGEKVANFTTHPRLSIALVYAVLFRCVNPLLSIAAFLSTNRHPFIDRLEDKSYVKEVKEKLAAGSKSDHIAISNLMSAWSDAAKDPAGLEKFCDDLKLSLDSLKFIDGIKQVLAEHLYDAGLIEHVEDAVTNVSEANELCHDTNLVKAALTAGIGSSILRVSSGTARKGRIRDEEMVVSLPTTDTLVELSKESVLHEKADVSDPWMIYHAKFKSGDSKKTHVREVSSVHGGLVALFGGSRIEIQEKDGEEDALICVDGNTRISLATDLKTAKSLFELRENLNTLLEVTLKSDVPLPDYVQKLWEELRSLLMRISVT